MCSYAEHVLTIIPARVTAPTKVEQNMSCVGHDTCIMIIWILGDDDLWLHKIDNLLFLKADNLWFNKVDVLWFLKTDDLWFLKTVSLFWGVISCVGCCGQD